MPTRRSAMYEFMRDKGRCEMYTALCGCLALMIVLGSVAVHAVEPLVLYDGFNATRINPDKWFGSESGGMEAIRQIQLERLHMTYRDYGNTDSDTGSRSSSLLLEFTNSPAVTAVAAVVSVEKFVASGCATPGAAITTIIARLAGRFFNTGTPTPGSATNDVFAHIGIQRRSDSTDPPNVLRVVSAVSRCTNFDCSSSTTLDSDDLGPITTGESVRLRMQWDQANHRFIFKRGADPRVLSPYTVSDASPAGAPLQRLQIRPVVANCTAEPRPQAFMRVFFDDVFVNESAVP